MYVGPPLTQAHLMRRIVWRGGRNMLQDFGNRDGSFLLTSPVSLLALMADVVNFSLMLTLSRGVNLGRFCYCLGRHFSRVKSQLIVISGDLTAEGYRDEVIHRCSPSCVATSVDFAI